MSGKTVRRQLREKGLNARTARRVPLVSVKKRKCRMHFAKVYKNLTPEDWENNFFSDESKFKLMILMVAHMSDKKNELYDRRCVTTTVKYGGGRVINWGGFSSNSTDILLETKETLLIDQHTVRPNQKIYAKSK